jgi:hypothetical protein
MNEGARQHHSEEHIDQLARMASPAMTDEHIKVCSVCRERFEFLRSYYDALERELAQSPDNRIEKLASSLRPSNIIELKPYHAQADVSALGADGVLVLAAQSIADQEGSVITVATYASEQRNTLVRVLHNRDSDAYSLYVLSDDQSLREYVIIAVRDSTQQMHFAATGGDGVAEMKIPSSVEWGKASLVLLTPLASFNLSEKLSRSGRLRYDPFAAEVTSNTQSVSIAVASPEDQMIGHVLVVLDDGTVLLAGNIAGTATFPFIQMQAIKSIRLFP